MIGRDDHEGVLEPAVRREPLEQPAEMVIEIGDLAGVERGARAVVPERLAARPLE